MILGCCGMTSWRDLTSPQAQDDLDGLLTAVLPFAEQTISKYGEMYPFGAAVTGSGELKMLAADSGSGDHPGSQDVLNALYAGARQSRDEHRAVAFAADVKANGSDAVRVELEHQEGTALTLLVPYERSRFKKTVTLGQMAGGAGDRRIWAD
jgi:hypothetical protein